MDIKKKLKIFKDEFDVILKAFLDKRVDEVSEQDQLVIGVLKHVNKITLSGGKRLRPALMYYGYLAAGGSKDEKIMKAVISIELLQSFLLIHDDIIDRDDKRHGVTTTHVKYAELGRKINLKKDHQHFGNSIAIIAGDMLHAMASMALYNSGFSAELILKALNNLQSIVAVTIVGEAQDVHIEYRGKATEEEVIEVYRNKTAKYTIEGPLHTGAILAGGDSELLKGFTELAIPLGIAFQIQDDILGVFGSEKKIGKPLGSDIEEGKQTILVVKALELGNSEQRKIVSNLLGKKNLSVDEIERFKLAINESGALEYSKNLAEKYILEGKKEVEKLEIPKEPNDFLIGIADYMANREL
ncbi:polyprenyl synthetase family protein [Patescibacteria group bacterium]